MTHSRNTISMPYTHLLREFAIHRNVHPPPKVVGGVPGQSGLSLSNTTITNTVYFVHLCGEELSGAVGRGGNPGV